jgi:hypothetical protein
MGDSASIVAGRKLKPLAIPPAIRLDRSFDYLLVVIVFKPPIGRKLREKHKLRVAAVKTSSKRAILPAESHG